MSSEEPARGEVLPALTPVSTLEPRQLQAAIADASGMPREDIARLAGVSTSAIKQWRERPDYREEVARLKEQSVELVMEGVKELRREVVDGARTAVKALVTAASEATDSRGREDWAKRTTAAKTLLEYGIEVVRDEAAVRASEHGNAPGGSSGVFTVVVKSG
jgi:predicted transcriptional regulator